MTTRKNQSHGLSRTPAYKIFTNVLFKHRDEVCAEWQGDFLAFLDALGPCVTPGYTLCRRDKSKPYDASNCFWGKPTRRKKDLTGEVYGELTVLRELPQRPPCKNSVYACQCSCGNVTEVWSHNLRSGKTKTCGHGRLAGFKAANEARQKQADPTHGVKDPHARAVIAAILERIKE